MVGTKNEMTTSLQVSAGDQNYQKCQKLNVTNIRKLVLVLKVAKYMLLADLPVVDRVKCKD